MNEVLKKILDEDLDAIRIEEAKEKIKEALESGDEKAFYFYAGILAALC